MNYWNDNDVKHNKELGVKVLYHCTNIEVTDTNTLPSNTYIIGVIKDGRQFDDIVQGSMSDVFNVYYDKFGKNSILYIKNTKGRNKFNPAVNTKKKK